jgi:hypothetical protein
MRFITSLSLSCVFSWVERGLGAPYNDLVLLQSYNRRSPDNTSQRKVRLRAQMSTYWCDHEFVLFDILILLVVVNAIPTLSQLPRLTGFLFL